MAKTPAGDEPQAAIPRLWSARRLADRLSISEAWIRIWRKRGFLRAQVLRGEPGDRGKVLFPEAEVIHFLEARGIRCQEGLPVDGELRQRAWGAVRCRQDKKQRQSGL